MPYKVVVKVEEPVLDEDGQALDIEGKRIDPKKKDQVPAINEVRFYLLHWGLTYNLVQDKDGNYHPVNYTVGICQALGGQQTVKEGSILMLTPDLLTVEGSEKL